MIPINIPDEKVLGKVPKSHRILAVVGDGPHGLSMVRDLGMNGLSVLTVCETPDGRPRHSRFSSGVWVLEASPDQPEFVDEILELAHQYDVGSIITLSENKHIALIEARERFEPNILILSPPEDPFKKTLNKEYMRQLCEDLGVPVSKGMLLSDFLKSPEQDLGYPRVMRTRHKHGENTERNAPWKVAYSENEEEYNGYVEEVLSIADNILVEEYHPGTSFHVEVFMHKGEPFFAGSFIGEHLYPFAGGVTVQRSTCELGAPYEHAVKLLKAIDYEGNASVCFRYDTKTKKFIFTEINPRCGGATPTTVRAGFPIVFLNWQARFEPEKMVKPHYRTGVRTRDFKGSFARLKEILNGKCREPGRKKPSKVGAVATFLWHCGPWTHDDVLLWCDPKPYIVERLNVVSSFFSKKK